MPLQIDENSKLSKALDMHPDVLEYIVSLNPHDFERLRNPLMRKLMPPRISVGRVAKITDRSVSEIIIRIHEIGGFTLDESDLEQLNEKSELSDVELPLNPQEKPEWISDPVAEVVDLLEGDARLDIDPMPPIFKALNRVGLEKVVLIKHMWEPQPLYDLWIRRGIEYYSVQKSENEWWIYIREKAKE